MTDLAVVVFVAILVFAATRISALGDALGRAVARHGRRAGDDPPREGSGTSASPEARP
ncbi:twin-arginine translocase TatA/TatE family subunit [Anaeromyxobacter oryzisoli]|uniref:twin-arginine translocase TatA/TatE family subunit n=1 Tax=Anaeromyxobacter oryzisoli TaxID=2925408 RepID=UPI001F5686DB